jgi:hypothetical protein
MMRRVYGEINFPIGPRTDLLQNSIASMIQIASSEIWQKIRSCITPHEKERELKREVASREYVSERANTELPGSC